MVMGCNNNGRLGQDNTTEFSSPVQIPGTTWSSISVRQQHSLATKTDGTLWSWGSNRDGVLGQNNRIPCSSPVQIPGTTWSVISGGTSLSLATKTDGTLWAWGLMQNGTIRTKLGMNISFITSTNTRNLHGVLSVQVISFISNQD
jgi:alpha-tubulin suppressor-like RCC1 family protein